MKDKASLLLIRSVAMGILLAAAISSSLAQSQSQNGQIEGTVSDENRAAVPNAVVRVTNTETGSTRTMVTDDSGVYRFPLLPLGIYRVMVEAPNFRSVIRDGVTLATGQTATVDLNLQPGEIRDVVTISRDSSVADAGKTDLSRVRNTVELQTVPEITRNPYNFAFLQANVTGRPARGFPFTTINANGYLRRVSFLLDGNANTQGDRGTLRFLLLSETYVSEVQLLTNGFAAEFGNTPGMIMNVVTPSGTNKISGSVNAGFRTPSFYSRPFGFSAAALPNNKASIFSAAVGGPIVKDRWHFYFGYERQYREDKAAAPRLVTILPENRAALIAAGLPASIFPAVIPSLEKGSFYILRTDVQINDANRLTVRYNHSDINTVNLIQGMLNTLDRGISGPNVDHAIAVQLASYSQSAVNEFRFQYAQRVGTGGIGRRNEFSGTGPSITITNIANFGSPEGVDTAFLPRKITQVQDNLAWIAGAHIAKFGAGATHYDHSERASIFARYTFSSIPNYVAARNGSNPQSYAFYDETLGDPEINYKATYWNLFLQDDWKVTRRFKMTYGLRYDLYQIPKADGSSPYPASQSFNVDKNNFSPRFGIAYALRTGRHPTVIRAGAGIYYDQPLLAMYQRALVNNGNPRFFTFRATPGPTSPQFPNILGSLPPGSVLPRRSIDAIAPDFVNMYAIHSNIQLEHAITEKLSIAVGFV
ncbi:MAG: TonB-dependent receptor, partial [Acidobacteriota bacterium]